MRRDKLEEFNEIFQNKGYIIEIQSNDDLLAIYDLLGSMIN